MRRYFGLGFLLGLCISFLFGMSASKVTHVGKYRSPKSACHKIWIKKQHTLRHLRRYKVGYCPSAVTFDPRVRYYYWFGQYQGLLTASDILHRKKRRHLPIQFTPRVK